MWPKRSTRTTKPHGSLQLIACPPSTTSTVTSKAKEPGPVPRCHPVRSTASSTPAKTKNAARSSAKEPLVPPRIIIPSKLLVKSDGSQSTTPTDGKAQPILSGLLDKSALPPNATPAAAAPRPPGPQALAAPRMSSSIVVRASPKGRPPKQISIPSVSQLEKVITDSIHRGVDVSPKNFPSFTPLNSEGATSLSSVQTYVGALSDQVASFMKEIPEETSPSPQNLSDSDSGADIAQEGGLKSQPAADAGGSLPGNAAKESGGEPARRRVVAPTSAAVLVLPKPPEIASDSRNSSNHHHNHPILLRGRLVTADTSGNLLSSAPYTQTVESFDVPEEDMEVEEVASVEVIEIETPDSAIAESNLVSTTAEPKQETAETPVRATRSHADQIRSENPLTDVKRARISASAQQPQDEEEEEPPPEYEDLTKDDEPEVFIDLTKPELAASRDAPPVPSSSASRDDCPMPRRTPLPTAKPSSLKATPLCRSSLRPHIRAQKKPLLIPKSKAILRPTLVTNKPTQETSDVGKTSPIDEESGKPASATSTQQQSSETARTSVTDVCDPDIEKAGNRLLEPQVLDSQTTSTTLSAVDASPENKSETSAAASETRAGSRRRVVRPSRRCSASKVIALRVSTPTAAVETPPTENEASQSSCSPAQDTSQPSTSRTLRASRLRPSISPNVPKKPNPPSPGEKVESPSPLVNLANEACERTPLNVDENSKTDDELKSASSDAAGLGSVVILPKNLQCSQCPYKTHTQKFLDLHVKSHKVIPCALCNRTFSDEASLKDHKRTDHSQNSTEELYECPKCEYKTRHQVYISRHITLKHPAD